MSKKNISFILHKPQLSENIGACARALKNFSFSKFLIVDPKPVFPNDKINATSVGAKDIIYKSKIYDNFEKSIEKIDILVATTSRFRNKNIKHITISELDKIDYSKKVGFLFGAESSGLSNHEVSYANYTLEIPTSKIYRSINLSHSLIIMAYELDKILLKKHPNFKQSNKIKNANKNDINKMLNFCIEILDKKNFFYVQEKKPIMIENLRALFNKLCLSKKEVKILTSIFVGLTVLSEKRCNPKKNVLHKFNEKNI